MTYPPNRHCLLLFFLFPVVLTARPVVPSRMEFAGMELTIHETARRKIEKDVEALTQSPKYFQIKLDRVDTYLPLIEQVFEDEGVPDDFKYLAIQESALISDAVSSSNAVGYWQFKKESAIEVGLTVNNDIDERKHIISATRGAAKYLKRNNFFLKNWVFTLLSYNMGLGGCRNVINARDIGASRMDIDGRTHWYIIKFLAHKIAFQDAIKRNPQPALALLPYSGAKGKTFSVIARELEVPLEDLQLYNKWLSQNRVPDDREYIVMIPTPAERLSDLSARLNVPVDNTRAKLPEKEFVAVQETPTERPNAPFPVLEKRKATSRENAGATYYRVNGKPGIQAQPGDDSRRLATQAGISLEKFLTYNDIKRSEKLIPGEVYYLRRKRSKAKVHEHVAIEGETLWQISQKYGITLRALMRKNRMKRPEKLQHGRVLWLRFIRPADEPVEIRTIPKPTYNTRPDEKPVIAKKTTVPTELPQQTLEPVTPTNESPVASELEKPAEVAEKANSVAPVTVPEPKTDSLTNVPAPADSVSIKEKEEISTEPTVPTDTPTPTTSKMHRVTTGETLYAIARRYGVTVADLRTWNNLSENDGIREDQELIVTAPNETEVASSPSPETFTEYTVKTGDTLYKIARSFRVTVPQLMEWNNKQAPEISIGEKLKVKKP